MIKETFAALKTAKVQKDAFLPAGRPYVSVWILESAADLGYAPHDKCAALSYNYLLKRQFLETNDPRFLGTFMCGCCPTKSKKFNSAEELR